MTAESGYADLVEVEPIGEHRYTLIFMHGLGDNGSNSKRLFNPNGMVGSLPGVKVVLPTAPTQKVNMNNDMEMTSWFNVFAPNTKRENTVIKRLR